MNHFRHLIDVTLVWKLSSMITDICCKTIGMLVFTGRSKSSGDADKKGTKRKRSSKKKDTKSKANKDTVSDISDSDDDDEEEEEEDGEKQKEKSKVKSASEEEEEEVPVGIGSGMGVFTSVCFCACNCRMSGSYQLLQAQWFQRCLVFSCFRFIKLVPRTTTKIIFMHYSLLRELKRLWFNIFLLLNLCSLLFSHWRERQNVTVRD